MLWTAGIGNPERLALALTGIGEQQYCWRKILKPGISRLQLSRFWRILSGLGEEVGGGHAGSVLDFSCGLCTADSGGILSARIFPQPGIKCAYDVQFWFKRPLSYPPSLFYTDQSRPSSLLKKTHDLTKRHFRKFYLFTYFAWLTSEIVSNHVFHLSLI